ncbi:flagellar brake protein [Treponema brennaborense]|uniref:Type IV pilus assembly PilZ n=1 Tax=Treponema brennaborense (strain DSM 12168 / CIP 105900 / DD5/3) TaxID=906968 RepID=F4LM44_TREBD|nr:PilZ domain-containing protein [Treponema brennaborense]AEE16723.1 type IV pilus assembly PilZ [Treponema brennaborense DSM 12168]
MYILLFAAVLGIAAVLRLLIVKKDTVSFFITGLDSGFTVPEILMLRKLAKFCNLEEPQALYLSVPALNRSIAQLLAVSKANGTEFSKKTQDFLSKLYAYRTKVELDPSAKKGLQSTKYLDENQKIRVVLKNSGVFASYIIRNARELIVKMPSKKGIITMFGSEWVGKQISVYLWRRNDAHYVFDTTVLNAGQFASQPVLYLAHSDSLTRAQKRREVRVPSRVYADMYLAAKNFKDDTVLEEKEGYRCLLEDISVGGALIRIGGKCPVQTRMKIQFPIGENYIVMVGIIRAVEYNKELNQSRLHFECLKITPEMRNSVFSYVYNVLPPEEKEVFDALAQTDEDKETDGEEQAERDPDEERSPLQSEPDTE